MQVSKQQLHNEISSIHELYRNYARIKADHNLLQRKYKRCLLSLKTARTESETMNEDFKNNYIIKQVHDVVVKDYEELRQLYTTLKADYNNSVNDVQISYQSSCKALNDLRKDYEGVTLKCEELTSQNRLLENMSVNVNKQLKEENEDLIKELEHCKRDNAKVLKENERLRLSVQELQRKYEKLLSSNNEFTRECDRLRSKVQSLDVEMKQSKLEHEKKLSRLTEDNECLLSKLANLDAKCSEVAKQRDAFEVEVRTLEKQLESAKCGTSFDLQRKYDKSVRNYTSILMDIRQLLGKYDEIKVDAQATEEKFFVQKGECDAIACDDANSSSHVNSIANAQENRDCQVINHKYKIKELISDSPTLEQPTQDEDDDDDDMLKFIFDSTKFTVVLLSPIASPTPEEDTEALISISDVGDGNDIDDLVEKDMLIGEHQCSWTRDEDPLVPPTTLDITHAHANIDDKEQPTMTTNVEEQPAEVISESMRLGTVESQSQSTKHKETIKTVDESLSDSTTEVVSSPTNKTSSSEEIDRKVATDDESIKIPINPDLISTKKHSDKKLKILTDFDNVDSAFGSLCSSDEELVTAEQSKFEELSKLNDATLGFKDDGVIVANSTNKLLINKSNCRACDGFNLRKRNESFCEPNDTKKRRIDLQSSVEEFSDDSDADTFVEPRSTRKIRDQKFVKANRLIKHMLQFSNNNNIIFETARNFVKESPEFLVKLILKRASTDILDTPTKGQYPMEPRLTLVQKGLYKFTAALEALGVEGVCKVFFKQADLYIRSVNNPRLMEPVIRLYVAFCKGKSDYSQMRMALCSALADLDDLAVPYMYTVLQAWIEVLPRKDMASHGHVLTKAIVQLVLLKNVNTPGYNLTNLRSLLFNYYGFSSDGSDSKELFKELLQYYLGDQNECARVLAIALSNHLSIKFIVQEIFPILSDVTPTKSVPAINSAITLVMHLTKHLYEKMNSTDLQKNLEWLRRFSSELYPYAVREHAKQLLSWFLQCDSVPYNILEAV